MRLPEQRFWDRTRARLAQDFRLERIENMLGAGMPDVLCTARDTGRTVFIELKAVTELPRRISSKVLGRAGLNQDQKNWHMDFCRARGTAYILVGIGSHAQILIEGRHADAVNDWPLFELQQHAVALEWEFIKTKLEGK